MRERFSFKRNGAINAVLQKVHGDGVTQYVRRDSLLFERMASLCGKMGVLGDETLDRIAAESAATDTSKDRIFGQTVAFPQPGLKHPSFSWLYCQAREDRGIMPNTIRSQSGESLAKL